MRRKVCHTLYPTPYTPTGFQSKRNKMKVAIYSRIVDETDQGEVQHLFDELK